MGISEMASSHSAHFPLALRAVVLCALLLLTAGVLTCNGQIVVGDGVEATYNLRVHSSADTLTSSVITTETAGSVGSVLQAPVNYNGWTMWDVSWSNGSTGWSVQNYLQTVVTPATLSSPGSGASGVPIMPTFSWSAASGATTYTLQVSTNSNLSNLVINQTTSSTSYSGTTLSGNTTYYWRVWASASSGAVSFSSEWNFTTAQAPPSAPSLVSPSNGSTGVATVPTFSWSASSGATLYTLLVATDAGFTNPVITQSTSSTSYSGSSLSYNTTYYWKVDAVNSGGAAWSSVWSFTSISQAPPPSPTLSSPSNGATNVPTTVTLSWNAPSGPVSWYWLQVSTDPGFTSSFVVNYEGWTNTSYSLGGLASVTTYYWRVAAANAGGVGAWSNSYSFTTAAAPPQAPVLSSPSNGSTGISTSPTLSWSGSSGATSYRLQLSSNSGFSPTVFDQSGLTSTSQQIAGLVNNTTYYWQVDATNSSGTSAWSSPTWSFTTTAATPSAPSLLSPSYGATGISVAPTLSWNSSSGATSYALQVSTDPNFVSFVVNQSSLTGTSYALSGLSSDTTYYWRVDASNAGGTSAWSSAWSFTASSSVPQPPSVPTLLSPPNQSINLQTSLTLKWSNDTNATGYQCQVSSDPIFGTNIVVDDSSLTDTTDSITNLANGSIYYWRVRAYNNGGLSAFSLVDTFATIAQAPGVPTLISPVNNSTNQPAIDTLRCSSVSGAAHYDWQVSTSVSFASLVVNDSTADTTNIIALTAGTKYYWQVRAVNPSGASAFAGPNSFTVAASLPAPALLGPPNGSTGLAVQNTLAWNASPGAASYRVQVSTDSTFVTGLFLNITSTDTFAIVSGLANGATYYWRVNAANGTTTSAWSNVSSFTTTDSMQIQVPMVLNDWQYYSMQSQRYEAPSSGVFQSDSNGLQFFGSGYREGAVIFATVRYNLLNSTIYFKWEANGNGYMGVGPLFVADSATIMKLPSLSFTTTDHSYNGSTYITDSTWYFTRVKIADSTYIAVTSTGAYDDRGGVFVDSTSGTLPFWPGSLSPAFSLNDNYGSTSASATVGEVLIGKESDTLPPPPVLVSPSFESAGVSTNLTLTWTVSTGATSYGLQVSTDTLFANLVFDTGGVAATSLAITGLSNSTKYYWRVNAANASGTSLWSNIWSFTTKAAPTSGPVLMSPTNGSMGISVYPTLTWNASAGATGYRLQVSTDSTFATTTYDTSSLTTASMSITGLSYQTKYYWRVNATNASGTSMWSNVWAFTTGTSAPAPALYLPVNGATAISTSSTLSWYAAGGQASYKLQISSDSLFATVAFDTVAVYDTAATGEISMSISGLSYFTRYYWRVAANVAGNIGRWSAVWNFTTVRSLLPPSLASPSNGSTQLPTNPVLAWSGLSNAIGYQLQVSKDSAFAALAFERSSINTTSQEVTGLSQGTSYLWRVSASDSDGSSDWSSIWSFTTFSYPTTITISDQFTPPGTSDQTNYRIIGLPGAVDIPASSLLSGNEGTDWEAYYDNGDGQNYQMKYDGSSTFDFSPGHALWIFSRNPFSVSQNASTVPLDTSDSYPILLHAGWNLISDPFEKSILWSAIQTLNGVSQPIYSFTGSYSTSTSLDPYTGYYFYNDRNLPSLRIPYVYSATAASRAIGSIKKVSSVQNDVLKLSVSSKQLQALPLTVGFDPTVSDSLNKLNVFAPPDNFDHLRIQVVDQNVRGDWKDLYADFRSEIGKGQSFDVEVKNLTGHAVTIRPTLTSSFENYGVYLVDNGTHTFYNLKTTDSVAIGGAYKYKSYALLVGDGNYIDSVRAVYAPKAFELYQNYPNPFNPTTIIRYEIPKKAQVTLQVYNVLGQLVRTLVNEVEQPGYYEVGFNASGLASGVYFCRLIVSGVESTQAGNYSHTVKMVVLR